MPRQFLCRYHRNELATDATAALKFWVSAMENGQISFSQRRYQEAIELFGGAYEAAEILFEEPNFAPMLTVNHLTASAIILAKALCKAQQLKTSKIYMQAARNHITQRTKKYAKNSCFCEYGELCLSMIDHCYVELFDKQNSRCQRQASPIKEDTNTHRLH